MSTVTTVTAFIDGPQPTLNHPGFNTRLRELLSEFGVQTARSAQIAIDDVQIR